MRRWKRMLDGWQGKKDEAQVLQGWKRTFRPLRHSTLVSETGSNSTPCAIPVHPVHLLSCLSVPFITYSEDFCLQFRKDAIILIPHGHKGKLFFAVDFYCLSFHFFMLNCPFYCSSRLFVLKSWASWS